MAYRSTFRDLFCTCSQRTSYSKVLPVPLILHLIQWLVLSRVRRHFCQLAISPYSIIDASLALDRKCNPAAVLDFGNTYPLYRECAKGVQNTSSDLTKDSISLWCSGIPTTGMS